jgi:hypothetical protein
MKKVLKNVVSVMFVLFFASIMFYCFIAGAPAENTKVYMIAAVVFSVLMPLFSCGCVRYIIYLEKKLKEKEES